ncbi:MAG: type II toxin-antitoxin system Phd/YefM family antitoxin [Mycobacterium sp.]|jgi:prevent-host-death family protein
MQQIGIRELRQHASVWVAKVKAGATIQITDRGNPVARLVPINSADQDREALIAAGLLIPAARPRTALSIDDLVQGAALTPILDEQRSDR